MPDFPPGPYGAKQRLAYEIVKQFHGQAEAERVVLKWREWTKLRKEKKAPKKFS
jgi:tyrosyl-tRNA synthetase